LDIEIIETYFLLNYNRYKIFKKDINNPNLFLRKL